MVVKAQSTPEFIREIIVWKNTNLDFSKEESFISQNKIEGSFEIAGIASKAHFINMQMSNCTKNICQIHGNAYHEVIGNIIIEKDSRNIYNKNSKKILGIIKTHIWHFPLSGIGTKNNDIELSTKSYEANHNSIIQINNANSLKHYEISIIYQWEEIQKTINKNNNFTNIDLSLAWNYDFIITEKESWKTINFNNIIVSSKAIPEKLVSEDFFAKRFCQNKSISWECPDGSERKWSLIEYPKNIIADWERKNILIKLRDKYGNRISPQGQNLSVHLKKTKAFAGIDFSTEWKKEFQLHKNSDISFSLIFYQKYSGLLFDHIGLGSKNLTHTLTQENLQVSPPISVNILPPNIFYKWWEITVGIQNKKQTPNIQNPEIQVNITTPKNITLKPLNSHICTNNGIWLEGSNKISCTFQNNKTSDQLRFTVDEKNGDGNISGSIDGKIAYTIRGKNFEEKIERTQFSGQFEDPGKIIGNESILKYIGNLNSSNNNKAQLWNQIRKNISYLQRNRNNFNDSNYIISRDNINISSQPDKQSYIAIGSDIVIESNITKIQKDKPIALIAISKNGIWGNIIIKNNVTDIEASLLAYENIKNLDENRNKDSQLYILGSVISKNNCMTEGADCLPNLRESYKSWNWKNSNHPIAQKYKWVKVIVEQDYTISKNPPPGIDNFME